MSCSELAYVSRARAGSSFGSGQDHLAGERVPGGDGGAERGLIPAVGKGRPDRPGPPRRAAQVDDAGVPAPTAAPAVHLGHVLRLRPDAEMPQGNAAGLITGVQQADPHRAQPVSKLEHQQVRPHGTHGARGAHLEPTVAVVPDRPDPVVTSTRPGIDDHFGEEPGQFSLDRRRRATRPVQGQLLPPLLCRLPPSHQASVERTSDSSDEQELRLPE